MTKQLSKDEDGFILETKTLDSGEMEPEATTEQIPQPEFKSLEEFKKEHETPPAVVTPVEGQSLSQAEEPSTPKSEAPAAPKSETPPKRRRHRDEGIASLVQDSLPEDDEIGFSLKTSQKRSRVRIKDGGWDDAKAVRRRQAPMILATIVMCVLALAFGAFLATTYYLKTRDTASTIVKLGDVAPGDAATVDVTKNPLQGKVPNLPRPVQAKVDVTADADGFKTSNGFSFYALKGWKTTQTSTGCSVFEPTDICIAGQLVQQITPSKDGEQKNADEEEQQGVILSVFFLKDGVGSDLFKGATNVAELKPQGYVKTFALNIVSGVEQKPALLFVNEDGTAWLVTSPDADLKKFAPEFSGNLMSR